MVYLAELYYLQDQKDFPFQKAVLVTATAVSRWSNYYYAELIAAKSKNIVPTHKSGSLPINTGERNALIAELVSWLFENSAVDNLFCLFLDAEPAPLPGQTAKFDHHDDTGSWLLNLTESEFAELQAEWEAHGLPEDLFYPQADTVCIPHPGDGLKARLLRAVGVQKCYTPKQWENKTTADNLDIS